MVHCQLSSSSDDGSTEFRRPVITNTPQMLTHSDSSACILSSILQMLLRSNKQAEQLKTNRHPKLQHRRKRSCWSLSHQSSYRKSVLGGRQLRLTTSKLEGFKSSRVTFCLNQLIFEAPYLEARTQRTPVPLK
jgi:hypothetical protein